MTSIWPGAFDTLSTDILGGDSRAGHAALHDQVNAILSTIEHQLGINPAGADSDVEARLDRIEAELAAGDATNASNLDSHKVSGDHDTRYYRSSLTLDQLLAPAASLSLASKKITNLANPTAAQDAATKAYVDAGGGTSTFAGLTDVPAGDGLLQRVAGALSWKATTDFILATARGAANGVASLDAASLVPTGQIPALPESKITNLVSDLAAKEALANKGAASGYASLDASTLVPVAQIPALPESKITNLVADLAAKEVTANKGVASGYASLDGSTLVPLAQIPALPQSKITSLVTALAAKEDDANKGAASGYAPLDAASLVPLANLGGITDAQIAAANKDGVAGTASMRTIGTGAQQAMAGNKTLATIAAPGADVSLATHKLTNVVDPTGAQDAATKNYVDVAISGVGGGGGGSGILSGSGVPAVGLGVNGDYYLRTDTKDWYKKTAGAWAVWVAFTHNHTNGSPEGQINHNDLVGLTANDHHNQQHTLKGTDHIVSGATAGQVLKATSATAIDLVTLNHNELGGVGINDHHNRDHALTGSNHTASGLTAGDVLTALSATTFGFATPGAGGSKATPRYTRTAQLSVVNDSADKVAATYTIPGGTALAGDTYLAIMIGRVSTGAAETPNISPKLKLGGTVISSNVAIGMGAASARVLFYAVGLVTIRGAAANPTAVFGEIFASRSGANTQGGNNDNTGANIDLTVNKDLTFEVAHTGAASATIAYTVDLAMLLQVK